MGLNTTQIFLETHTHSEFWILESRGQNKPNLGLVHVLLAHTAPNRCSPALPPNPTRRPIGSRRRRSLPLAARPNPTRSSAPTPPPSSWFPPPSPPRRVLPSLRPAVVVPPAEAVPGRRGRRPGRAPARVGHGSVRACSLARFRGRRGANPGPSSRTPACLPPLATPPFVPSLLHHLSGILLLLHRPSGILLLHCPHGRVQRRCILPRRRRQLR